MLLRRHLLTALAAAPLTRAWGAERRTLRVGPLEAIRSLAQAARLARDGDLIEVQAGDYRADVAAWPQNDLSLKALGGRVHLLAQGVSAQGKGIFVTTGERIRIEGFDFSGCQVPSGNGAGIRLERGSLSLLDCRFTDNEMGVLTSNDAKVRLDIDGCEFASSPPRNGGGLNHNLYAGSIASLRVVGSYFHHGQIGHLLKSRAAVNHIFYNRLSDEIGGQASYELEFPNGGQALVVGNLIQQSSGTENPHMVSFGAEGLVGPQQELQLINNTLIDQLPSGGIYLRVSPGAVKVRCVNNILSGNPRFASQDGWELSHNFIVDWDAFVLAARENYALRPDSKLRGKAIDPGAAGGLNLAPTQQYRHPRGTLALTQPARHPGAFQIS